MTFPNLFTKEVADNIIERINTLTPSTQAKWGKMSVDQMLAHCNVPYEMVYENKHPKPGFFLGLMLRFFVKKFVTNEVPYKNDLQTAPAFIIKGTRDFESEKKRLIDFIIKTQQQGEDSFDNKLSHSFGKLSKNEWNTMFYKHINHHLAQFGA